MMGKLARRTTVYLDPALHRALRLQSLETSRSVSELINDAVRDELLEDAEDFSVFEGRKNESIIEFEDFVKGLKRNGTI